jgi:hypothetical protein
VPQNGAETITTLSDYAKIAVQRWYAPRLNNGEYPHPPSLNVKVNGDPLEDASILPLCRLIRNLYKMGTEGRCDDEHLGDDVHIVEDLELRKVFDGPACPGKLVVFRAGPDHPVFRMTAPENNPSPYAQVYNCAEPADAPPPPIIAMTRKPGMIVDYKSAGSWTQGIKADPDGKWLIALFILRTDAELVDRFPHRSLEEYVRLNEPPAHDEWRDVDHGGIHLDFVTKLRKNIVNCLNKLFTETQKPVGPVTLSDLSEAVAAKLLGVGFGSLGVIPPIDPGKKGGGENKGGGRTGRAPRLEIIDTKFSTGKITVAVKIRAGASKSAEITLNLGSEKGSITAAAWDSEVGTSFPFAFASIDGLKSKEGGTKGQAGNLDGEVTQNLRAITTDGIDIEMTNTMVSMTFPSAKTELQATFSIKVSHLGYAPSLEVKDRSPQKNAPKEEVKS